MPKKPLCPEELQLSYSKYWFWKWPEKNPLSQELLRVPVEEKDVLPFSELNQLLRPGYLPREQGCCVFPDGTGYNAIYIWMPGVTVDMIDWWFVWHFFTPPSVPVGHGNLRYKIWCPAEHVDTGFDDEASRLRAADESIPMRERRYGAKNYIFESLDDVEKDRVLELHAQCFDPVDFGFDPALLKKPSSGTIIAAATPPLHQIQIYQFRPCGFDGVEMRIRNYIGYDFIDGKPVKAPGFRTDRETLIGNAQHVLGEYPNLARFLPKLYEEEHRKPVDAY